VLVVVGSEWMSDRARSRTTAGRAPTSAPADPRRRGTAQDSVRPPPLSLRRASNRRSGQPEVRVPASRGCPSIVRWLSQNFRSRCRRLPLAPSRSEFLPAGITCGRARTTRGRRGRTLRPVNTAAVLADAMTDYVLTVGGNRAAPAAGAPEHMAAWLKAHGYQVVHHSQVGQRPRSAPPWSVAAAGRVPRPSHGS
jgi:hypothetical protein